jgi:hypothetical protein
MLAGPAIFLKWLSQHNADLAYVLAYLLAFYAPAIVTGFSRGTMFSAKTLIEGVWSTGFLVVFHLGSLLFQFDFFGASLPLVFLLAFARERGIIVPKRRG